MDHDMVFGLDALARILSHPVGVVGAPYPKRTIEKLELTCVLESGSADRNGLRAARHVGAGFLSVGMDAIEAMERAHPELAYVTDHPDLFGKTIYHLFGEHVVMNDWSFPGQRPVPQLMLEDVYFCHMARKAGLTVYADMRCEVGHIGTVNFLDVHRKLIAAYGQISPEKR